MGFDQWSMLFAGQSLSDDKAPNVNLVQFSKAMMQTKDTAIAIHFIALFTNIQFQPFWWGITFSLRNDNNYNV